MLMYGVLLLSSNSELLETENWRERYLLTLIDARLMHCLPSEALKALRE